MGAASLVRRDIAIRSRSSATMSARSDVSVGVFIGATVLERSSVPMARRISPASASSAGGASTTTSKGRSPARADPPVSAVNIPNPIPIRKRHDRFDDLVMPRCRLNRAFRSIGRKRSVGQPARRGESTVCYRPRAPVPRSSALRPRASTLSAAALVLAVATLTLGCAGQTPSPKGGAPGAGAPGVPAVLPKVVRIDPQSGGGGAKPPGLAALQEELQRGMHDLSAKGKPPPYFIGYEVHDRSETTVMASYGALVQSTERRTRILDADVRVGDYKLDSTHAIRSSDFDFASEIAGHPVQLPLSDDETALRTVAWAETDRRYEEAAERLVKIRTQRTLKVADDDPSDDFSREKPVTYFGLPARLTIDVPTWEARLRKLSARFRGQAEVLDSDASLQATSLTQWLLNSRGRRSRPGGTTCASSSRPTRGPTTGWSWSGSRASTPRRWRGWAARRR